MRPPVRPPQLRCVFFSSMYLPHLLVLPATFWTSVPFATLSVFPSLICGSCPSGQRFAYSFFQIPSHGGHPCCSAMCFVVAYAHLGLSPIRKRPCWANKTAGAVPFKILRRQDWFAPLSAGACAPFLMLLQQPSHIQLPPPLLVMGKAQVQGPFPDTKLHILVAHVRVLLQQQGYGA